MIYLKNYFILSSFLFVIIHNIVLLQGLVAITTSLRAKTLQSKNVCCPHYQKPRVLISTLASFELFDVHPWSSTPDNGVSLDLILVSLHTSYIIFAVRFRKSLCRMYRKPPFLQIMSCSISSLLSQGQDVSRLYVFPTISESY